jgi:hypothetical protein
MKYAMDYHVVPLINNSSSTATLASPFVDMRNYTWVDFIYLHPALAAGAVTVIQCPASSTTGSTIDEVPFVYRKSAAIGTDTLGAATTASTAGYNSSTVSGLEVISVDPRDMGEGYHFLRVSFAGIAASDSKSVLAILHPRYAQATPISSS